MLKMRELVAIRVLMYEHPFNIVEEKGFNMMQKRGMLKWNKISYELCKANCEALYQIDKKKLKEALKSVSKISLTIDL